MKFGSYGPINYQVCVERDQNLKKHTLQVFSTRSIASNGLVLWPKQFTLLY